MSCRRARPRFRSIAPIAVLGTIALGGGAQGGDHLFGHTKYKVVQGYVVQPQAANNVVVVHAVAPAVSMWIPRCISTPPPTAPCAF